MKSSVLDSVLTDLNGLQQRFGARNKVRLRQHARRSVAISIARKIDVRRERSRREGFGL
jgi:hypothetical protein